MRPLSGLSFRCIVLFVALGALATIAGAQHDAALPLSMRWALAADPPDGEPVAITQDTQLASGNRLRLMIEPRSAGYFYVILRDAGEDVHVLFRQAFDEYVPDHGVSTYIPAGGQWFELSAEPGAETFFLLASSEPLPDLERLLDAFAAADDESRRDVGNKIVQEIRRQHKAHRKFSRPVEKPVLIGGKTRGAGGIDHLAAEVTAERFYGKTITIDH